MVVYKVDRLTRSLADFAKLVELFNQRGVSFPHRLDLDRDSHRMFCACDSGELITLDAPSVTVLDRTPLSGSPDVVFFDREHKRLYVAVGDRA